MAVKTIEWKNDRVIMLDQRLLPHREVYRSCRDYVQVADAIRDMVIRGAPAIGVAAAMGVALGALHAPDKSFDRRLRTHCRRTGQNPADRGESILGAAAHARGLFGPAQRGHRCRAARA